MKSLNLNVVSVQGNSIVYKSVDCVATVNQAFPIINNVIDSITVTADTRVLLTAQTDPVENGIYLGNDRATDMDSDDNAYGIIVYDIKNKIFWISNNTTTDIIGTDALNFSKMDSSNLGDFVITSPVNGQTLQYDSSLNSGSGGWKNVANSSAPVTSVFGRTGAVVATEGDYSLTQLSDVTITTPVTNQIMRYGGSGWVNSTDVISFNTRTGAITPATGDYSISQITNASVLASTANVTITTPTNNQILTYNSSLNGGSGGWLNATYTAPVTTVFGRTGAITATEGDYRLTQLSDVTITAPTNTQMLRYNGSAWVNATYTAPVTSVFGRAGAVVATSGDYSLSQINGVYTYQFLDGTFNGAMNVTGNTIYIGANMNFTLQTGSTGQRLLFAPVDGGVSYLIIPSSQTVRNNNTTYTNCAFTLSAQSTLELVYVSPEWKVVATSGTIPATVGPELSPGLNYPISLCAPTAELKWQGAGTYTLTLTSINTWYKIAPSALFSSNNSSFTNTAWSNPVAGRLTYDFPQNNKYHHGAASMSLTISSSNRTLECSFHQNGAVITSSIVRQRFTATNDSQMFSFHNVVQLSQNNYVEIFIRNLTSNNVTCTFTNFNLVLMGCCSFDAFS